jgi:drug/metabolite transporter (DMT)-like permease
MAGCLAAIVVLRHQPWPWLLLTGGAWCGAVGVIIFATGSHHISDVIGGYLFGFAIAVTISLRACPARRVDTRAAQRSVLVMLTGVMAAVVAAELARRIAVSSLPPPAALLMTAAGLCATAFSLVSLFLRLLEPARAMEATTTALQNSALR